MAQKCAALSAVVATLCLGLAVAQEGKGTRPAAPQTKQPARQPSAENSGEIAAIRAVVDAFLKAYNGKDANTLAGLFTEDAEIEDDDGVTRGRTAIKDRFAQLFAENEGGKLEIVSNAIRLLSSEAAFEEGTAKVSAGNAETAETSRYSVFYVKRGGRWLQARIRDEAPDQASAHDRLKDLEWMLGEWVNESDDAIVFTTCRWADNGNFLVRDFDMKIEGRLALRGTQRIGWDPLRKQFRTWLFDDEGGFGDGLVSRSGDAWIIKMTGVRSDGQPASATSIVTPLGKDRVGWQLVDRTLGSETSPNIDQFVMVRKPPEPGK
jgi:uncharacterized protein (TIGR02246 family)